MRIKQLNQKGFHLAEVIIIVVVLGALGFAGSRVMKKDSKSKDAQSSSGQQENSDEDLEYVEWSWNGSAWQPLGDAPDCEDPLTIKSPVDPDEATAILYPGQVRGGDFKPHGGIGSTKLTDNKIDVKALRDAYVFRGSRYIEQGEVQYMFDFIHPCGVVYRLDHLHTLTDDLQKVADTLPEAKVDDSRTSNIDPVLIKSGTKLATAVGFIKTGNAFFDVGVYDLRQPNEASKTDLYKTDQGRIQDKEQSFYALCWFDNLAGTEKTTISALPAHGQEGTTSDYCD